nr:RNA methyltransferase family protein [Tanacetum cinerariifolium]
MNLTSLVRTSYITRTLTHSIKPISSSSLNPKPKTPLYLKPPIYTTSLSSLKKFQKWAKTLSSSVNASFKDSSNLHQELSWLLQDSLQNPNILQTHEENDNLVNLRLKLDDLYDLWTQRIENRRPFQYIVGCEHWRDLILSVEEGVLIPRPETELIVDLVNDVIKCGENGDLGNGLWVDLGTGSGAIAIGIGRVLGELGRVVGVDLSDVAVTVASYNVERYNIQDKISIKQGSWFEPLSEFKGQVAGLVSNPPYIPSGHIDGLQPEVGRHEPILALDGGDDGMSDLLRICNGAASMLKSGGFFAFETNGEDHCRFLVDHMEAIHKESFFNLKIVPDFAGIQRFVTGFRS